MKNKIGMMVPFFTEIPIKRRLELLKEAGFTSFMMSLDRNHEKFTDKLEKVVKYCKDIGLEIGSGHAPYTDPDVNEFWSNSQVGDDIEEMYMQSLEFAKNNDIKTVVFHLHFKNYAKCSEHGLNRLKRMVKFAEQHNINIAVENLYKYGELDYIFENIKSNNIGFCYDTGHENFLTPNSKIIHKHPEKLMALHLNDNDGKQDLHSTIYTGSVNWDDVSYGLANANKVNLDAEVRIYRPHGMDKVDEETLLKLFKREFKALSKLKMQIEMHRKKFE